VAARRRSLLKFLIAAVLVCGALYFTTGLWLPAFGRGLVYDDGPGKADIAVVLAGDVTGARMTGAAELVRRGYVPAVMVSGPPGFYGINEADAAIHYIVEKGYPAEYFIPLKHHGLSTHDEASALLDELKRRGVQSFVLVTSNFHTRRARRIFLDLEHRGGGGPQIRVLATPDRDFDPDTWWRTRQGRKVAFLEWTKTVTSWFGV
jgi:uncharacterized SAM-binding protein YcdF (DUF218 family)